MAKAKNKSGDQELLTKSKESGSSGSDSLPILLADTDVASGTTASSKAVAGRTVLSDIVVRTIAGVAAREVMGVYSLGRGGLKHAYERVAGTASTTEGIFAEVGNREVAIDIEMSVQYGFNIRNVASQVRALITARIEQMTGLMVKEINIHVEGIHYEGMVVESKKNRVE